MDDLLRDPSSVDHEAMHNRIASFWASYETGPGLGTDMDEWQAFVRAYHQLYAVAPTPVVALNRAIAMGETEGPRTALKQIEEISGHLDDYHLMHATRGAMLHRLGRDTEARIAYQRAAELAPTERDRRLLGRRIDDIDRLAG